MSFNLFFGTIFGVGYALHLIGGNYSTSHLVIAISLYLLLWLGSNFLIKNITKDYSTKYMNRGGVKMTSPTHMELTANFVILGCVVIITKILVPVLIAHNVI